MPIESDLPLSQGQMGGRVDRRTYSFCEMFMRPDGRTTWPADKFNFLLQEKIKNIKPKYGHESTLHMLVFHKIGVVEQLTLAATQRHHFC